MARSFPIAHRFFCCEAGNASGEQPDFLRAHYQNLDPFEIEIIDLLSGHRRPLDITEPINSSGNGQSSSIRGLGNDRFHGDTFSL